VKLRIALIAAGALITGALPAAAQAATLKTDRACYGPGEKVVITGAGFTPGGQAVISQDARQLIAFGQNPDDPSDDIASNGTFQASGPATVLASGERKSVFTASDPTNPALTATATTRFTALDVVGSLSGRPEKPKKLRIRGFTHATTLYAHVRRGKKGRNIRLGRVKKPCGTLTVKKRFFPRNNVPSGIYHVFIDGKRTFSKKTRPSLEKVVQIFKVFHARAGSAFAGNWTARP